MTKPIKTKRHARSWAWREKWKGKMQTPQVGRILPNIVTIAALSMGLTAIQFAFLKQWHQAVASVLMAGFLDGVDGRLARFLKSSSEFGAELDSLADFINFGVAPSLVNYFFSLHVMKNTGWGISLFFSTCMALRLARFNIQRSHAVSSLFSVGLPAPAAGLLVLSPMIASFVFDISPSPWIIAMTTIFSALMMISRYPTFVFKKVIIPQQYMSIFLVLSLALIASLISAPWETLLVVCCVYILSLPIGGYYFHKGLR